MQLCDHCTINWSQVTRPKGINCKVGRDLWVLFLGWNKLQIITLSPVYVGVIASPRHHQDTLHFHFAKHPFPRLSSSFSRHESQVLVAQLVSRFLLYRRRLKGNELHVTQKGVVLYSGTGGGKIWTWTRLTYWQDSNLLNIPLSPFLLSIPWFECR